MLTKEILKGYNRGSIAIIVYPQIISLTLESLNSFKNCWSRCLFSINALEPSILVPTVLIDLCEGSILASSFIKNLFLITCFPIL